MATTRPLLLTGAAGALGQWLRPRLIATYGELLSSDVVPIAETLPGETFVACDLADGGAVERLVARCGAILHFGGVSTEAPFMRVMQANLHGVYNVFEAARVNRVGRIVFASSNHVIGFHPTDARLDADAALRPDTFYGVSKAFGENMARLYHDKHGLEFACLRIGSCFPEPTDIRQLSTWLAREDLLRLIQACLAAPRLGCQVIYGASNNRRGWWDNGKVEGVDFRPEDDAERFAPKLLADGDRRDPQDPAVRFQGGSFCAVGYDRHD
jgi:uronate dehydrogenase